MVLKMVLNKKLPAGLPQIVGRLPRYLRLTANLYRDWRVKPGSKARLLLALGYSFSPVDLIPGFLPVVGQLDDAYIVLVTLRRSLRELPPVAQREHLAWSGVTLEELEADLANLRLFGSLVPAAGLRLAARVAGRVGRAGMTLARKLLLAKS